MRSLLKIGIRINVTELLDAIGIASLLVHGTSSNLIVHRYSVSAGLHPALLSERGIHVENIDQTGSNESLLIDEFEIIELEDRLELASRCNGRCDKQAAE